MLTSTFEQFKQSIDDIAGIQKAQNMVPVKKSVLLSFVSDATGVGHIRNIFPVTYLNAVYGKNADIVPIITPIFIWQHDILLRTKAIYFQRQMSPEQLKAVQQYKELQKKYQYKMVWDIDDFIWGANEQQGGTVEDGIPTYNFGWRGILPEIKDASIEIMKLMDLITVSTEYLRWYLINVKNIQVPIQVVPNAVPKFLWGNKRKKPITKDIVKPKIIYTGSPTHYNNQEKMAGDFDNAWKDWVIKAVNENKIEFVCMGGLPFFFECIKDKIKVMNWVNSFQYHHAVKDVNADFGIMPLVPNNFNYSKSDIKAIELYTCGVVCFGTTFINGKPSPYDNNPLSLPNNCSVGDIDRMIEKYSKVENYNKILDTQYNKMVREHRYTEDPAYVKLLIDSYFA
jgi:hypothetical protein